jgi:uncharacterized membrane protein YqgA involved in biofilm formation
MRPLIRAALCWRKKNFEKIVLTQRRAGLRRYGEASTRIMEKNTGVSDTRCKTIVYGNTLPYREKTVYWMIMIGPLVNAFAIVVCSLVGYFVIRGIPERYEDIIKKAIGLSVLYVGIKGAFDNERVLLLIMSMVSGAIIGEFIDIDRRMNRLGNWAEKKLGLGGGSFSKGFVSASILFCTGSMAIVGSMQSGLQGNHETLFAKSILDGSISIVFSASMGIGVAFSALPVLIYQGAIVLASLAVRDFLSPDIIREMSAVGSLLVAAIGINFISVKEIKVANLIPAIFIPWLYLGITGLFSSQP